MVWFPVAKLCSCLGTINHIYNFKIVKNYLTFKVLMPTNLTTVRLKHSYIRKLIIILM